MTTERAPSGGGAVIVSRSNGRDPVDDLATEEALLEAVAADGAPRLHLYGWPGPVVVLGYAQPPGDVDLDRCRRERIPVLRRVTGGTGVVHRGDLALALALPRRHPWAAGIRRSYRELLSAVAAALEGLGVAAEEIASPPPAPSTAERSPVCFLDPAAETLLVGGRKVVGGAQARRRHAVLVHLHLQLSLDAGLVGSLLRTDPESVRRGVGVLPVDRDELSGRVEGIVATRLGLDLQRGAPPVGDTGRWCSPRWSPVPVDGGAPAER